MRRDPSRKQESGETLLLEQLARVTAELRESEVAGRRAEETAGVIRSLRKTLASIAKQGAVVFPPRQGYAVTASEEQDLELWHRGRKLPVAAGVLRNSFERCGLRLRSGQGLLADRDLALRWVEESLVALSLEEFRIRQAKAELLRSLEASSATQASAS